MRTGLIVIDVLAGICMAGFVGLAAIGLLASPSGTVATAPAPAQPGTVPPAPGAAATAVPARTPVSPAAPKGEPTPFPSVGATQRTPNWQITLDGFERLGPEITWSRFGNKEQAIGEFVAVRLTLENIGNRNFGLNFTDYKIRTGTGAEITSTLSVATSAYVELQGLRRPTASQIPPGVPYQRLVVFDVPPGATDLTFVFDQSPRPSWRLPNP